MFYLKPPRHISTLPIRIVMGTSGVGAKRTFAKHRRLLSADSVEKVFFG